MFDLFRRLKARFSAGFESAKAQPPLGYFQGLNEAQIMVMIELAARRAHDAGVSAEKSRTEAILTAPGAAIFPDLAADLLRGQATAAQAIQVLSRAENDAATRAATIKSNLIESSNASTIH